MPSLDESKVICREYRTKKGQWSSYGKANKKRFRGIQMARVAIQPYNRDLDQRESWHVGHPGNASFGLCEQLLKAFAQDVANKENREVEYDMKAY